MANAAYALEQLEKSGRSDLIEVARQAFDYTCVPTVAELERLTVRSSDSFNIPFNIADTLATHCFRDLVLQKGFVFPCSDMLDSWAAVLGGKRVADVMCGTGWLTGWLRTRRLNVTAVDNKTWKFREYERWVVENDAVNWVKRNPADVYICAWPYMDDTAHRIWNAMRPGERMLYVGESWGGCTADENFFRAVGGSEEEVDLGPFYSFWGIHDRPTMYLKKAENE